MAAPYEAEFVSGDPIMVDYTAGAAFTAGTVIVTSATTRITHRAIANGDLGAVAAGGGVYEVVGDAAITADKKVWWNDTTNKVTETASTHKVFGVTVTACSGDGAYCQVRHDCTL